MSGPHATVEKDVLSEIEGMLRDRFLEAVVADLQRRFPDLAHLAEDAVHEAVERAVKRAAGIRVETVRQYLYAVARNQMMRSNVAAQPAPQTAGRARRSLGRTRREPA